MGERGRNDMKTPTGAEILEILLKLYAEQEGVKIKYELVHSEGEQK